MDVHEPDEDGARGCRFREARLDAFDVEELRNTSLRVIDLQPVSWGEVVELQVRDEVRIRGGPTSGDDSIGRGKAAVAPDKDGSMGNGIAARRRCLGYCSKTEGKQRNENGNPPCGEPLAGTTVFRESRSPRQRPTVNNNRSEVFRRFSGQLSGWFARENAALNRLSN